MNIITISECPDYVAPDHAVAKEFLGPRNSALKDLSIAWITIPPGVTVERHFHKKSEETYHIVEGSGVMELDGEKAMMGPGQAVAIPRETWHSIANSEDRDLVMVVTCSPPWEAGDQYFA